MHIELFQDQHNGWAWRAVGPDSRVLCESAETYTTRKGVEAAADAVINGMRADLKVVARERRATERPEDAPVYDLIEVAEYEAEVPVEGIRGR